MLTADLVRVRRRGGELHLVRLDDSARERAEELAEALLDLARDHVGRTRGELEEAMAQLEVTPGEQRIADGLRKLIDDRCTFDVPGGAEPEELRRALFERAAAARRAVPADGRFDRDAILDEVARARGLDGPALERLLYSDLRASHVLKAIDPIPARALALGYDLAQAQAVLLRAVKVVVDVECGSPGAARALFRKLKFLRLLHTISPSPKGGHRITIDGPLSLFEAVTRYGLQLALALPAFTACDRWALEADLRWGKERQRLTFRLDGEREARPEPARLPDEIAALLESFRALGTPWEPEADAAILELPGVGLCVPDLAFVHRETGECVFLEVLGYWSREAVWRRVELVEHGLPHKILFAVSERLRVSEAALPSDGELPGALIVYKGTLSARAVAERIERLSRR